MAELINIVYEKQPVGFGKSVKVEYQGIKFDDGQIAYQGEQGKVYQAESPRKLKEALKGAVIEVL